MTVHIEPQEALDNLAAIVGHAYVSATEADRRQHARDQSPHPGALPDIVVWPGATEEVQAIVRYAARHGRPIVGWGAGTSLEGNPIPIHGGIVVDFRRMNRILARHAEDFQVTVQPGILYKDMNKQLARSGLFFAPDPGANASIGGMVANNAAGIRTVRYGATRDNVLALQVVLASGEVIRTGSRSVKQSAGYDLTHLFVGSEGTLGLVTEATLRLAPLPEHFSAVTAVFTRMEEAATAVFDIIGAGLNPAALEIIDEPTITVLKASAGLEQPIGPSLFMEFHGASEAALRAELALVEELCRENGVVAFTPGLGAKARNRLWETRHSLFEHMVRHHPGQAFRVTDVAVPIANYPQLVAFAANALGELQLSGGLVGHAGDGNLHSLLFFPADDAPAAARADLFDDQLVARALALEGTCTGEHGVGIGKRKYLIDEHGAGAVGLMRQIKTLLDPQGILNPGKVIP